MNTSTADVFLSNKEGLIGFFELQIFSCIYDSYSFVDGCFFTVLSKTQNNKDGVSCIIEYYYDRCFFK